MLAQIPQDDEILETYKKILKVYYNETGIKSKKIRDEAIDRTLEDYYFNYGFTEGLYQYWLKYYYPTCLNFTSFLALYSGDLLDYVMFFNTCERSFNKFNKFMEEQSIEMVRNEMSQIAKIVDEFKEEGIPVEFDDGTIIEDIVEIYFIWRAKKDFQTCKICKKLNGKRFDYEPNLAHPNCRCVFDMVIAY